MRILLMTSVLLCSVFAGSVKAVDGFDVVYFYEASGQWGTAYGDSLTNGKIFPETDTTHYCDPSSGGPSHDYYVRGDYYRFTSAYNGSSYYEMSSYLDYKLGAYSNDSDIVAYTEGWAWTAGIAALKCTETTARSGTISFGATGNGQLQHSEARQKISGSFGDSEIEAVFNPTTNKWTATGTLSKFPYQDQTVNKTYTGYGGINGKYWTFSEPVLSGVTYYMNTDINGGEENTIAGWSSGSGSVLNRDFDVNVRVE